jgi:CRISPR/Cas system CSM-associated protein Csm3 (group 7 of RAMP superfamily)
LGVRELERGHIQLGGFKGRGLGRVSLADLKVRGVSRDNLRDYLLSGEMASVPLADMDGWLQLVVGKLGKEAE